MSERVRDRYARLAGRFWRHPKVLGLSDAAGWLWARALSFQVDQLTDGKVTRALLKTLGHRDTRAADELVAAGLWEQSGDGYLFHDYSDHNLTSEKWTAHKDRKAKNKRDSRAAPDTPVTTPVTTAVTGDIAGDTRAPRAALSDAGRRTQDAGHSDHQQGGLDQVARGRDVAAVSAPVDSRSMDADAIRAGFARAYAEASQHPPRVVKDLDGRAWHALVDFARVESQRAGATIAEIGQRLGRGALARKRFSFTWLVDNPREFLSDLGANTLGGGETADDLVRDLTSTARTA